MSPQFINSFIHKLYTYMIKNVCDNQRSNHTQMFLVLLLLLLLLLLLFIIIIIIIRHVLGYM